VTTIKVGEAFRCLRTLGHSLTIGEWYKVAELYTIEEDSSYPLIVNVYIRDDRDDLIVIERETFLMSFSRYKS